MSGWSSEPTIPYLQKSRQNIRMKHPLTLASRGCLRLPLGIYLVGVTVKVYFIIVHSLEHFEGQRLEGSIKEQCTNIQTFMLSEKRLKLFC